MNNPNIPYYIGQMRKMKVVVVMRKMVTTMTKVVVVVKTKKNKVRLQEEHWSD